MAELSAARQGHFGYTGEAYLPMSTRRFCLRVDIGAIAKCHPLLGNVFFLLVPQPPATRKGAHTVHCAVISWLLKKVPVVRGAPVALSSRAPWLPLLQVPKLCLLDVHVCSSFAFPSTSYDSGLSSYDLWLTSNDLMLTSNYFWLTSYGFWLTFNDFWLTYNDLYWLIMISG